MANAEPILLEDDDIRRFIADGFLMLHAGLTPEFHAEVAEELAFSMKYEMPPAGDNVVARIPELARLMEAPIVNGAMISLLGENFVWSPHRATHNSEPLEGRLADYDPFANGPKMGKGSLSGSGWHQDGHSIAGRSRWHTPRATNMFYFPHDTPLEMGPTRLLAGSHWYANLRQLVREQLVYEAIPAGTVVITDFDMGHGGTPNFSTTSRYMVKFIGLRQETPIRPSWNNSESTWVLPRGLRNPAPVSEACTAVWNWMRGEPRTAGITDCNKPTVALIDALNGSDQNERLQAIYTLAARGETVVDNVRDKLLTSAGLDRHLSPAEDDIAYYGYSEDMSLRHFSHRQFVPEDATLVLSAMGEAAVPTLDQLIEHEDPWIRINAAYAFGELGPSVAGQYADKVGALLDEPFGTVVRAAIDALCSLTTFGESTAARLCHVIEGVDVPADWEEPIMGESWTTLNQVRFVSCWALLARITAGDPPPCTEAALVAALDETNGYIPAAACEGLRRLATPSALDAAVSYLSSHRFDHAHNARMRHLVSRFSKRAS
ncbi:MAG: HEAT repeat domain-containing protein [Pseudomonadota bacterium]